MILIKIYLIIVLKQRVDKFLSKELTLNTVIGNNGAKISGGKSKELQLPVPCIENPRC